MPYPLYMSVVAAFIGAFGAIVVVRLLFGSAVGKAADPPDFPAQLQRLVIKDGDVLVYSFPGSLSPGAMGKLERQLQDVLTGVGIEAKCIIMEHGAMFHVFSKDADGQAQDSQKVD